MIRPKTLLPKSKIPVKTKWGIFRLDVTERGLYAIHFPKGTGSIFEKGDRHSRQQRECQSPRKWCLSPLVNQLRNTKLDLAGYTPFQKKVYAALRKVPAGSIVTYAELAKHAGYPGAARAVGSAMKKNRLPIVIPCHRVIRGDGSLGQYSAGKRWKQWLLEQEVSGRQSVKGSEYQKYKVIR